MYSVEHEKNQSALAPYIGAWNAYVSRNASLFQEVSGNEPEYAPICMDYLALNWARHALGLRPNNDAPGRFMADLDHYDALYRPYVERVLQHLAEAEPQKAIFALDLNSAVVPFMHDPEEVTHRALVTMPHASSEIDTIQRLGRRLADIVQMKIPFLDVVSPNGDATALESFYFGSLSIALQNSLFAGAFESIAAVKDKPLRVLEVGGGTGGATASISHLIRQYCREYWFTDVSNISVNAAKRRFKGDVFRYQSLDLSEREALIALSDEKFDVVIASNAMHNVDDLTRALENIEAVMADDGCLLLTEPSIYPVWMEIVLGAAPHWWHTDDETHRALGPLSSESQWSDILRSSIGDCFATLTPQHLPALNENTLEMMPQTYIAIKNRSTSSAPAHPVQVSEEDCGLHDVSRLSRVLVRTQQDGSNNRFDIDESKTFESSIIIDFAQRESFALLLDAYDRETTELVVLLDHIPVTRHMTDEQKEELMQQWYSVLAFMRAAITEDYKVTVITVNAFSLDDELPNIALAPYRGIFATFLNEYPDSDVRTFDVDGSVTASEMHRTLEVLLNRPRRQEEIAERRGKLFMQSLRPTSFVRPIESKAPVYVREKAFSRRPETVDDYQIRIGSANNFDDLDYVPAKRDALGPDEVRVDMHFAALNYRDILKVMGEYPFDGGDYLKIGDEGAGIVTAVGENVDPSLLHSRVVVMGEHLLASQAVLNAHQVVRLPDHISLSEGATISVAYLTAHHALVHGARIRPGDRVLIHSAAGGVGLAAIKVAKAHGAIVHATASSGKRDLVRAWGADHVYDSRSLDFEKQIIDDTDGYGVDVVLNSLSGAFQAASMRLLAESGRFIELGKRDIYESRALNQYDLRKNISFHVIDMSRVFKSDERAWGRLFGEILVFLDSRKYLPLPYRVYRASHVGQAMRIMATGRHAGKILILMQDPAIEPRQTAAHRFGGQDDFTYLVVGGVTGFGLRIARYKALSAAKEVMIASRSDPDSEVVTTALAQLHGCIGRTRSTFIQCDVTDAQQVKKLIGHVKAAAGDGPICVIHAAGVYEDQSIANIEWESFRRVCAPKVLGALNLHDASLDISVDALCLVSSAASMLGSSGQCSYAAANAFLDGLAVFRQRLGLPASSVNIGPFAELGFLADKPHVRTIIMRQGTRFVPPQFALKAIENAIVMNVAQMGVFDIDWKRWLAQMRTEEVPDKLKVVIASLDGKQQGSARQEIDIVGKLNLATAEEYGVLIESYLCQLLADILNTEMPQIDINVSLASQGLDSLSTMELMHAIERDMPFNLTPEDFADTRTVKSMTHLLCRKYQVAIGALE